MHSGYMYTALFWLLAFSLFAPAAVAMSKEQADALKSAASTADQRITHIPAKEVKSRIAHGPWLIFWGIEWCKITQRYGFLGRLTFKDLIRLL